MAEATFAPSSQTSIEGISDRVALLNVPGRIERLPMTGYQRRVFAVIATAWLADRSTSRC